MNKKFMFVILTLVIAASIVFSPAVVPAAPKTAVHGANPAATAPTANFTGDPTWGTAPLQVGFTDQSTGTPTGWAWYFGDETFNKPWEKLNSFDQWTARSGHTSVALSDGSIVLMGGARQDVWRSTDQGATWTLMTDAAPWTARSDHTSVALPDDSIVLMGGYDGSYRNDVWRSTDQGATWTQMTAAAPWTARHHHTSVALSDGDIVLMGGEGYYNPHDDVWRSEDYGATWTRMTAEAEWKLRTKHSSVVLLDDSIVLMGGQIKDPVWYDSSEVWRSTNKGATWTKVSSAGWSARYGHTSVALPDDSIVLMGGYSSGVNFHRDVYRSTDQGETWTQIASGDRWTGRRYHTSVALPDESIVLMGGSQKVNLTFENVNDVWRSTDQGATWTQMTGWTSRNGPTSVALPDGSIVLMGGRDDAYRYLNDVGRSTDQGITWSIMPETPEWTPRNNHTSVALPDGSIVLMGGSDGARRNDVWRSTDQGATWKQKTAAAEWTGRTGHTSVALPDGSIVLMGGYDGKYRNDVWRSTDQGASWTQMTDDAPWVARRYHASVALPDGSILLMGGDVGYFEGGYRNDVWRSTDKGATWTKVTDDAPWTARGFHTCVALPDGSIVLMGGYYDIYYLYDVWRSTDQGATWVQVSDNQQWSASIYLTSVALPDGNVVLIGFNDVWRLETAGSTEENPLHIYHAPGTYPVALQVYNAAGFSSTIKEAYINVMGSIPDPDPDGLKLFLPLILH